jgi:hypothetical protein
VSDIIHCTPRSFVFWIKTCINEIVFLNKKINEFVIECNMFFSFLGLIGYYHIK